MNTLAMRPHVPIVTRPPVALVIEPSSGVLAAVTDVLIPHGYRVRVAQGIADALFEATLVLVEADRGSRAAGLIRRIYAMLPELPIVGVRPWWDDDEADLTGFARFIVHVPIRDDQLRRLSAFARSALAAPDLRIGQSSGPFLEGHATLGSATSSVAIGMDV